MSYVSHVYDGTTSYCEGKLHTYSTGTNVADIYMTQMY